MDHKESWTPKNWCFLTVVLEKTLESSLECKEIQPVHPKGDQPWVFTERTDAEAEAPGFWSSDVHRRLIEKAPNAGKDWGQEKRVSQDERASLMKWTWTWTNFRRCWRTGRPDVLQSMGLQRVRHDCATEQQLHYWLCCWGCPNLLFREISGLLLSYPSHFYFYFHFYFFLSFGILLRSFCLILNIPSLIYRSSHFSRES